MKITAEPRSDQWNADDFVGGIAKTFTVATVTEGKAEQKYDIVLEGNNRVWRPPLTVLRMLISAWGDETEAWVGHRVTLFRDDAVRFGPNEVGGIRISHLSHITKPIRLSSQDKRGSRKISAVEPLVERDWISELDLAGENLDAITALGTAASAAHAEPTVLAAIRGEYQRVKAQAATPDA
jgi:hypothetical protein